MVVMLLLASTTSSNFPESSHRLPSLRKGASTLAVKERGRRHRHCTPPCSSSWQAARGSHPSRTPTCIVHLGVIMMERNRHSSGQEKRQRLVAPTQTACTAWAKPPLPLPPLMALMDRPLIGTCVGRVALARCASSSCVVFAANIVAQLYNAVADVRENKNGAVKCGQCHLTLSGNGGGDGDW